MSFPSLQYQLKKYLGFYISTGGPQSQISRGDFDQLLPWQALDERERPVERPTRVPCLHFSGRSERETLSGQTLGHVGTRGRPLHHALWPVSFLRLSPTRTVRK